MLHRSGDGVQTEDLPTAHIPAQPYRAATHGHAFCEPGPLPNVVEVEPVDLSAQGDVHLHQIVPGGDPECVALDGEGSDGGEVLVGIPVASRRRELLPDGP